jgi:hypothetical protein
VSSRDVRLLAALLVLGTGPRLWAQESTGVHRTVVRGTVRLPEGMMTPDAAKALGSRFVAARVIPDSVDLRVGDTLSFTTIQLVAIDSTGAILGRLPIFDTRMPAGAAVLVLFRGARGGRPGVSTMTLGVPRPFWYRTDQAPPAAQLRINVHD